MKRPASHLWTKMNDRTSSVNDFFFVCSFYRISIVKFVGKPTLKLLNNEITSTLIKVILSIYLLNWCKINFQILLYTYIIWKLYITENMQMFKNEKMYIFHKLYVKWKSFCIVIFSIYDVIISFLSYFTHCSH